MGAVSSTPPYTFNKDEYRIQFLDARASPVIGLPLTFTHQTRRPFSGYEFLMCFDEDS